MFGKISFALSKTCVRDSKKKKVNERFTVEEGLREIDAEIDCGS